MAYTPINWATGDTITADKLNRCDNGWGVESTQLFSETVTTEDTGGMNSGSLAYQTGPIDAAAITVTFDGTAYDCIRIDAFGGYYYGGFGEQGPDFTDYPFCITSDEMSGNMIYTASAGTYAVAVATSAVQTSTDFAAAVNAAADFDSHMVGMPLQCIATVTTATEMNTAISQGRLLYFWTQSHGCFFISAISGRTVTIFPESSSVTASISTYGIFEYTES